jgi:hypothetical protein
MISGFTSDVIGFDFLPTEEQLDEVNKKRGAGNHYLSVEAAKTLNGGSTEKKLFTMKQFTGDRLDSPMVKMFRYGAAHEGYWTGRHMKLQIEDLVDWLPVLFPGHHFVLLFDQSSGHTKKPNDGLDVANMNISFGGKNPKMHAFKLGEDCLGRMERIFEENKEQQLVFPLVKK